MDLIVPPLVITHDHDNLNAIERWANDYMRAISMPSKCALFIPHAQLHDLNGTAQMDNFNAIERWARNLIIGTCSQEGFSRSCLLYIPFKSVLLDWQLGRLTLPEAQSREFDNYKTIENWANRLSRGEC